MGSTNPHSPGKPGLDLVVLETPLDYPDLPEHCICTAAQIFAPEFPAGIHEV